MSFAVKAAVLDSVERHPDADRLDVVRIGGYQIVARKGLHKAGDRVLFIPEDSVIPQDTAEKLGIADYLTGKRKDRVKSIRLRGVLSQGIVIPERELFIAFPGEEFVQDYDAGLDVSGFLGIEKYEDPIPANMAGKARPWPSFLPHYDLENIKKPEYFELFRPGELVVVTEKLHGSNMTVAWGPGLGRDESVFVCSRRMALEYDPDNLYWKTEEKYSLASTLFSLKNYLEAHEVTVESIAIRGEVLGCQDLKYGYTGGNPGFRAFDIMVNGHYVAFGTFRFYCERFGIPMVPLIHVGAFDYNELLALAEEPSALDGGIREGLVIKPHNEMIHPRYGRVALKLVSGNYLTRKGGTELE